jgi:heterodisulfide reductase subunit B
MQVYETIDIITKKFRADRKANNYLGLVEDGLALLEEVPKLVDISISQEAEYRKFEAHLADERDENGKRFTNSYCETQSKATEHYKEWQKAKQLIEFVYELVNMSKLLAKGVTKEFNSH